MAESTRKVQGQPRTLCQKIRKSSESDRDMPKDTEASLKGIPLAISKTNLRSKLIITVTDLNTLKKKEPRHPR